MFSSRKFVSLIVLGGLFAVSVLHQAQAADTISVQSVVAGKTPFLAYINVDFSGSSLSSANFTILPTSGSLTRPIHAQFSSGYLTSVGNLNGQALNIPVFGLYAGKKNLVNFSLLFTDGSTVSGQVGFTTTSYTDSSCPQMNSPTFHQYRTSTTDLNYDYFLLKDPCSTNTPAIIDTDGNVRWVGTAGVATATSTFTNNAVYLSDGKTGINRILLTTGVVQKIADFSNYGVTSTNSHNIDLGRNGTMILDVNANDTAGSTDPEAEALEFDVNGEFLNYWDMDAIISNAMAGGGDDPSTFVVPGKDWFHLNSTVYNSADNTLIVSSRENFVIAVDYDPPADGSVKKIHWILGDTTKKWYQYRSLRQFALNLGNQTPPIGQHAVSINHNGSLLFLDDGLHSLYETPAGASLNATFALAYNLNLSARTANLDYDYAPSGVYTAICGSIYDVSGTRLVDFANQAPYPAETSAVAHLQGLGSNNNNLIFDLTYTDSSGCSSGWNALPINLTNLAF